MAGKLGIDACKKAVDGVAPLLNQIADDFSDGKITIIEGLGLAGHFSGVTSTVAAAPAALAELAELDDVEETELRIYINQKIKFPHPKAERVVEDVLGLALHLSAVLGHYKQGS